MVRRSQRQQRNAEIDEKIARDKEKLTTFLSEEMRKEHGTTNKVLDQLRRTRAARGGVGAPLKVPTHLQDAASGQGVVITDADLAPVDGIDETQTDANVEEDE